MGWGSIREQSYDLQNGLCAVCGKPLGRNFVIHHKVNRCQNGKETVENAEARHSECEKHMHKCYRYGNYCDEIVSTRIRSRGRRHKSRNCRKRESEREWNVWLANNSPRTEIRVIWRLPRRN